jgi:ABC-type polysaccharide/polyol phosphate export systems, permease component
MIAPKLEGLPIELDLPHQSGLTLPSKPVVVIEPRNSWAAINLRDLWTYRELFYFLIWRDVKVRYKQTVIGIIWVVLQPLLMTLIFTIFMTRLARVPSGGLPYALLVFAGLLPWTFFSTAVAGSGASLVTNAQLITKVYFPRMIIPGAAIGGRLLDFAVGLIMLLVMMIYYGVRPTGGLLLLPPLIVLITLFSWGFGMWMSAVNVKYRDTGIILPVLIQLWMFVSPVAYPVSLIPEQWRWLYFLNPLAGIIEGFRAAVLGLQINWPALAYAALFAVVLFFYSAYAFRRMEKTFADII